MLLHTLGLTYECLEDCRIVFTSLLISSSCERMCSVSFPNKYHINSSTLKTYGNANTWFTPPLSLKTCFVLQLYPGLKQLLQSPPVYVVDNFFTSAECDALMSLANNYMIISPVVGAGAGEISESRTSSSCFLAREDLPTVCSKVRWYRGTQTYLEHFSFLSFRACGKSY